MAEILHGKPVAEAMSKALKERTAALAISGITPTLATLRVGERADDVAYERGIIKRCAETGTDSRQFLLGADATEDELIRVIEQINGDDAIHGCLMFRPLPDGICGERVRNVLAPDKDVDGITDISLAGVFTGTGGGYPPCTAQACMELLDYYGMDIEGRRTVVVGRSLVIGKPVAMLALARNATVTLCHSRTRGLAEICRAAEILIVAAGRPGLVGADALGPDAVVLDVGINVDAAGNLCGDVPAADAAQARAYTPVPGGVGSVTATVLAAHVVEAAEKIAARRP
jgi:methylenetetrahydrofolate dehydrogenase (NADP+)/methenyltetrahydrofolate cyclohydrolase